MESRIAGTDPDSRIRQLEECLKRRTEELHEYIRVERVLMAAGLLSEEKLAQAHEIARTLTS